MAYWLSVAPDKVQTRRDSSRALAGPAPERQWKLPPSTCISLSVSTVYPHKLVRSVRGVQISLGWYSLCLPSCKHTPLLFTYLFFYYHNHTKMQMYLSTNQKVKQPQHEYLVFCFGFVSVLVCWCGYSSLIHSLPSSSQSFSPWQGIVASRDCEHHSALSLVLLQRFAIQPWVKTLINTG